MKLKRMLTEAEIAAQWPASVKLQAEIESAGGSILITAWQDIDASDMGELDKGSCSKCSTRIVNVTWNETINRVAMVLYGVACPHCKLVLEYGGTSVGPVDLTAWLRGQ